MPYQLQVSPLAIELELLDELVAEEEGAADEGVDDEGADDELGAMLELLTTLLELLVLPKWVASLAVALMPLVLLIRKSPQVLSDAGFQLLTISSGTQQLPLPDQLQPK